MSGPPVQSPPPEPPPEPPSGPPSGLLPIGAFARRTGLSIGALRHYAEIGLLPPARVDPQTGYRYYTADQVAAGRRIASLRELDVPLPLIRDLRGAPAGEVRARLTRYRAQLEARVWRLQRQAHRLAHYTDQSEETPMSDTHTDHEHPHTDGPDRSPLRSAALERDDERRLAARLFNGVWELLERPERSVEDDDEMVHAAHASRYHWGVVGTGVNWARGEWQVSRVYAVLGRAEPALHHGRRCLDLVDQHGLGAFDRAYAHEALARGYQVAGDANRQAEHLALAYAAAEGITDDEERGFLLPDLAQLELPR